LDLFEINTDFAPTPSKLYRITPTGIENNSGPGAQPQQLASYVQQTRNAIRGTPLNGKPVGHVDTWTVYVNATNNDFISTLDFLGMDAYPYFQKTMANDVGSASQLFFDAYHQTAARGKPVWVSIPQLCEALQASATAQQRRHHKPCPIDTDIS
jgi:hypothetical protein